jgi:diguanylate cyclase (GGDEF)-like protein
MFGWFLAPWTAQPAAVGTRLLDTTLDRKFAVLFGTVSVLFLALSALAIVDAWWPLLWIAADIVLLALRLSMMGACKSARARGAEGPFAGLMAAGAAWALIFGLGCFGCLTSGGTTLAVLAALNVAGAVGIVSSRNAGTPRYAIFVMLAVSVPYLVGALLSPRPGMFVVGMQMPFLLLGVIVVLLTNHKITTRMIRAELDNRDLAVKDALTGLPNRIFLQERLRQMCGGLAAPAANGGTPFAVLSMDLDGFKYVNDSFGHAAGDLLLRRVAERLRRSFRPDDVVIRIGGDEFIALLPATSEIEATYLAKRAIEKISAPYDLGFNVAIHVGLSVGSAFAPADGDSPEGLLACSDLALYEAKRTGKGRYLAHIRRA